MVAFAYERWSLTRGSKHSDFTGERFILENWSWSLRKGGRLREVVATGGNGSTVHSFWHKESFIFVTFVLVPTTLC